MAFASNAKKNYLRSSKDIYDRLKWDSSNSYDLNSLFVGYLDRFDGIKEISFAEFEPGGDIPFHRVYYFRSNDLKIWDRTTKIDLVFGSGAASRVTPAVPSKSKRGKKNSTNDSRASIPWPTKFKPVRPLGYRFETQCDAWIPFTSQTSKKTVTETYDGPLQVRIMTFNILFGLYDSKKLTRQDERLALLIDELKLANPDVVGLQEVTGHSLKFLMTSSWIRETYYMSGIIDENYNTTDAGISPYGQLTLTKFKIIDHRRLNYEDGNKKLQIFHLEAPNKTSFLVSNLHLSSNHREKTEADVIDGGKKRMKQLKIALSVGSLVKCPVFTLGDFNYSDEAVEYPRSLQVLDESNVEDLWSQLKPGDPGVTFDPVDNTVTQLTVQHHYEVRRLDRIMLSDPLNQVEPKDINVVANVPIISTTSSEVPNFKLYPSDHYGVVFDGIFSQASVEPNVEPENIDISNTDAMVPDEVCQLKGCFTSTVCLVPPRRGPLYLLVQRLRKLYDPSAARWPPHLNILYGFVKDEGSNFEVARNQVVQCYQHWTQNSKSIKCVFNRFGIFDHGKAAYVFLFPTILDSENEHDVTSVKPMLFSNRTDTELDLHFEHVAESEIGSHPFNELYQILRSKFPLCGEAKRPICVPHMTVGKFGSVREAKLAALTWTAQWIPIECNFDSLSLLSRSGTEPFSMRFEAPWAPPADENFTTRFQLNGVRCLKQRMKASVDAFLTQKLSLNFTSQWLGSMMTRTDSSSSDGDICICSTATSSSIHDILSGFRESLISNDLRNDYVDLPKRKALGFPRLRFKWSNASEESVTLPIVAMEEAITREVQLEISIAQVTDETRAKLEIDCAVPADDLKFMEFKDCLAVSGINDSRFLINYFDSGVQSLFVQFAGLIKSWANARQISSKAYGFPPSITWTTLALRVMQEQSDDVMEWESSGDRHHLLQHLALQFFNWLNRQTGIMSQGEAITTSEDAAIAVKDDLLDSRFHIDRGSKIMSVLNPTFPFNNQCRNVTTSALTVLQKETYRALQHLAKMSRSDTDVNLQSVLTAQYTLDEFLSTFDLFVVCTLSPAANENHKSFCFPSQFPPFLEDIPFLSDQVRQYYSKVEAKIIGLIIKIDRILKPVTNGLVRAFPIPQIWNNQIYIILGLSANANVQNNLAKEVYQFQQDVPTCDVCKLKSELLSKDELNSLFYQ